MTKYLLHDVIPKIFTNVAPIKNEKVWSAIWQGRNPSKVIIKHVSKQELEGTKYAAELGIGPKVRATFNFHDFDTPVSQFMVVDRMDGDLARLIEKLRKREDFGACIRQIIFPKIMDVTEIGFRNDLLFGDVHAGNYVYSLKNPENRKNFSTFGLSDLYDNLDIFRIDLEFCKMFSRNSNSQFKNEIGEFHDYLLRYAEQHDLAMQKYKQKL